MKCLYLTYDGLLDPLGQSQVIPYVQCLVAAGHTFTIISYEKERRSPAELEAMEHQLRLMGVKWLRLSFRKTSKTEFARRILAGAALLRRVRRDFQPDLVHLRGHMPAIIYQLSLLRVPHLYDYRGFSIEEWTETGRVRRHSLAHRLLRMIDGRAVRTASGLVVLEKSAGDALRSLYRIPDVPFKVIRTCTDISLYRPRRPAAGGPEDNLLRFVFLGSARPPSYRPDLALRLVARLLRIGLNCRIDFINESDHREIATAVRQVDFPSDRVRIVQVDHRNVPAALADYDCGLIFYDTTSPWTQVRSPTKLGEYLAAGIPVVALEGIHVLDELAVSTGCVRVVGQRQLMDPDGAGDGGELAAFIRKPEVEDACRALARRAFSLEMAGALYCGLYAEIAAGF